MSRRPTSASNIVRFNGGDAVPPPPPEKPKALPPKKVPRVRVEMPKPKQQTQPGRAESEARQRRAAATRESARQKALTKLQTTTEALTPEERKIVRGFRLSGGAGFAAEQAERRRMEKEIRG